MTGEPLIRRSDDNAEALKKRLEAYHTSTKPLVKYYSARNLHERLDASQAPTSVFQHITSIFDQAIAKKNATVKQGFFARIFNRSG